MWVDQYNMFYNILILDEYYHLAPAIIKLSGVREEHAHIQLDIQNHLKFDSPRVFPAVPQSSGKTTGIKKKF